MGNRRQAHRESKAKQGLTIHLLQSEDSDVKTSEQLLEEKSSKMMEYVAKEE